MCPSHRATLQITKANTPDSSNIRFASCASISFTNLLQLLPLGSIYLVIMQAKLTNTTILLVIMDENV